MIETERLVIQSWSENDAAAFFELSNDSGFNQFSITDWRQKSVASARAWIVEMNRLFAETKTGALALREQSSGDLIGIGALRLLKLEHENRHEITYRLRESAWGKGYATETARALLEYGFRVLGLDEIAASITPDNLPSKKVVLKLGMKWTGSEILLGKPAEIYRLRR